MKNLINFAMVSCLGFAAWGLALNDLGCVIIMSIGAAAFAALGELNRNGEL